MEKEIEGEECKEEDHAHAMGAELVLRPTAGKLVSFFIRETCTCAETGKSWRRYRETTPWIDPTDGAIKISPRDPYVMRPPK